MLLKVHIMYTRSILVFIHLLALHETMTIKHPNIAPLLYMPHTVSSPLYYFIIYDLV